MNMLRYGLSELKAYPRYTALFVLNVSLGLFGLALLESFKSSIQERVIATSREQTGGDLVVSSRIPIPSEDLDQVKRSMEQSKTSYEIGEVKELFTMAAHGEVSRLVQLHSQESNLPFYGEVKLRERSYRGGPSELDSGKNVWVYPELLTQFGAKIGDELMLNGIPFTITDSVQKDAASNMIRGSMSPRVYISPKNLSELGLVQKGSTVNYQNVFKLNPAQNVDLIEKAAREMVKNPAIQIDSHLHVNESNAKALAYLGDYLGLIALIALLLSNIGTVYLFRAHLVDRLKDQSILKILGLTSAKIIRMTTLQTLSLGICGIVLSVLVSTALFPVLSWWSKNFLPFSVPLSLSVSVFALVSVVGIFTTVLCVFPLMGKLRSLSCNQLFQEEGPQPLKMTAKDYAGWLPLIVFFFALAVFQSRSLRLGSLFCFLMAFTSVLLVSIGYALFVAIAKAKRKFSFEARYAVLEIVRKPLENIIVFVALSMGVLLMSLIFIVEGTLKDEFDLGSRKDRTSLFLFDIQEEELPSLKNFTHALGFPLQHASPLIRARLETINGETFERNRKKSLETREEEISERSRSRSFNLTERETLFPSESVSQGRYFIKPYDPSSPALPEISLEEKFAERMKLKVGDKLGFDVQGTALQGQVVGFRKIKWVSFQPNFFIQFQPGVFQQNSKMYLASLRGLSEEQIDKIQGSIVEKFPGVAMLNITRIVERILELSAQMSFAIKLMATLVFFSAMAVLLSIGIYHEQRLRLERELLHYIGLVRRRIVRIRNIHMWILCSSGLAAGWSCSFLVAAPITKMMFDHWPSFSLSTFYVFALVLPIALYQWASSRGRHG